MAEPQQNANQEPSMEEILASIRKIISDDAPKAEGTQAAVAAEKPADGASNDILELTQMVADDGSVVDANAPEPTPVPPTSVAEAPVVVVEPEPKPEVKPMAAPADTPAEPLVSDTAANAAKSAFSSLATTLQTEQEALAARLPVGDGTRTIESLVLEILRPLVKQWLDQNLPGVVERAVQKEIERISRRVGG